MITKSNQHVSEPKYIGDHNWLKHVICVKTAKRVIKRFTNYSPRFLVFSTRENLDEVIFTGGNIARCGIKICSLILKRIQNTDKDIIEN